MLLRMYNEASTVRETKFAQTNSSGSLQCPQKEQKKSVPYNNNGEDGFDDGQSGMSSSASTSTMARTNYAQELEGLIRMEEFNRVAILKQIASDREQRTAMKQLLEAVSQEARTAATSSVDNQSTHVPSALKRMKTNVQHLIFDAVIGQQMVEAALEEETMNEEQEFQACYSTVIATLREDRHATTALVGSGKGSQSLQDQEKQISALIDGAGGSECPNEILQFEAAEAFRRLYVELRDDLAMYEHEFITVASAADAAGSKKAAALPRGGWNESNDERLVKVLRSYEKKAGSVKKPQLLYEQIRAVLPNVPLQEIKRHVTFHQHLRFHQQKRKDRQREFRRRVQDVQAQAKEKFRLEVEQEKQREQKLRQLKELQQQCENLHGQVSKWRVTKEAKERIEEQQREIDILVARQQQQEEKDRWKRKIAQQRVVVEEYRKGKALDEMAAEKLSADKQREWEEKRAVQSVVNAKRVHFRRSEFQRKLEEAKLEEMEKAQQEQQRLAKLSALKEETPYAQVITSIMPDPERTRQETAAFRANVEAAHEGLPLNETGLFPSHGYDCETLFKNARFKLGLALRNAGLNSSEYARQALATVKVSNAGAYRHHVAQSTQLW